ncbi:ABC transporter permease [Arenibacterium sp. LLYu02]|uniref:ABC transporter permease n=1 Tax=Arenibacterium sp. LLYu02 TaxID=3404132 RepID=UPI003B21E532
MTALKTTFALLAAGFLLLPLIAILPLAFTSSVFLSYPVEGPSLRWFTELTANSVWLRSITNSLGIGLAATALSVTLGSAAALGMRRNLVPFTDFLRTLFLLPMVIPAVVLGVGLRLLMTPLGLANSYLGVIIAHTVLCEPFVVVSVSNALAGIDPNVEKAAESLGAPPVTVFWLVTFPLAAPGIVTGAVFSFATSLDEVILTLFVAGPNQRTLARQMFSSIRENISPAVAAAAFAIITGTVLITTLIALARRRSQA